MTTPSLGILQNRRILLVLLSKLMSTAGSTSLLLVITWTATVHLGGPAVAGLALSVDSVAQLVLLLLGGVLADRASRGLILGLLDLARTGILGVGIILLVMFPHAPVLLGMSAVLGAITGLYSPATTSFLADLVPPDQLPIALGVYQSVSRIATFLGPMIGGIFVVILHGFLPFLGTAFLYGVSGVCVLIVRLPGQRRPSIRFLAALVEGVAVIRSRQALIPLILLALATNVLSAPLDVLLPQYFRILHEGTGGYALGMTLWGIGMGIGGLLFLVKPISARAIAMIRFGPSVMGAIQMTMGLVNRFAFVLVLMFILGVATALVNTAIGSRALATVSPDVRGRVSAFLQVGSGGLLPLAFAATAGLDPITGALPLFIYGGAILAASALAITWGFRWDTRTGLSTS